MKDDFRTKLPLAKEGRGDSKKCMIMANDNNIQPVADDSQIVLYQPDESIRLEVKLEHDTVWLNRQQMAQLFGRDIKTIGKHINNALHEELALDPTGANFATIENSKNPTVAKFAIVQKEGGRLVTIIDGYVSSLTLSVLDVRKPNVTATIYTVGVGQGMQRLMEEHDRLFPDSHIDIRKWRNESHDRWLIIDDSLYHCGHSLNANGGHKISAITLMGTSPEVILSKVE